MTVVVLRADASPEKGTGHVVRLTALAEALTARGASVVFVTGTDNARLLDRMERAALDVVPVDPGNPAADIVVTLAVAARLEADWIVLDGYHLDATYRSAVRGAGYGLLCIDDTGRGHFECDVVVNPNLHGASVSYSTMPGARLLRGPRYALLRREFSLPVVASPRQADGADDGRLLVSLGGADAANGSVRVLKALDRTPWRGRVRVIVGPASPHGERIARQAEEVSLPVEVIREARSMVAHMAWADRCITAGGGTCLECCRIGIPMAVGVIAENQVPVAATVEHLGMGIDLGWIVKEPTEAIRDRLASWLADGASPGRARALGPTLVDGRGAERVAEVFETAPPPLGHAVPGAGRARGRPS